MRTLQTIWGVILAYDKLWGEKKMALSPAQLLKRKEKKNKERAEKAKEMIQMSQIQNLDKWPIVCAYAPPADGTQYSLQHLIIARQCPNGKLALGMFLVDCLCLGIKDCYIKMIPPYHLDVFVEKIRGVMPIEQSDPSYVATLIHQAIAYARSFGFEPRGDYSMTSKALDSIPLDSSLSFTFGEDGKPLYVQGPHDSPQFVQSILKNPDIKYILPMGGHWDEDEEEYVWDEEEESNS